MKQELDRLFKKITKSSMIHVCTLQVESGDEKFKWSQEYGGRSLDSTMNLASISKLFVTTCIINLVKEGKISLEDKISKYFDKDLLKGIHIYKGIDYSYDITINNLLFQNTGFPDVFAADFNRLNRKMQKEDFFISFEEYIEIAKNNKKKFPPGTKGRAYYSDLNFEMLGKIIEAVEGCSLHTVYKKYIIKPLGLTHTYLLDSENTECATLYYKNRRLNSPKVWSSIPACGGVMSTSNEVMIFLKAFFTGTLFDKSIFKQLSHFARIQYCPQMGQYGGGLVRLNIAGIASLYRLDGELLGHMGGSGSFAYYYPDYDLYMVGDVNQFAKPSLIFTIPLQIAKLTARYGNTTHIRGVSE